jgi:site-specific recombinase XerD
LPDADYQYAQGAMTEDLFPAEPKIEAFLTDLAVHGNMAATTQNQAMNALVFLYKRALNQALPDRIKAIRASKKTNVPVVMTREEVAAVLALMDGTAQLVAKRLYGSGLRIMAAVRLPYPAMDKRTALANVVAANSSNRQHIPPSA